MGRSVVSWTDTIHSGSHWRNEKVRGFIDARRRFGVSLTQIRGSGVTGFGVPLTPKAKKWPISLLYSVSYGDAKIPSHDSLTHILTLGRPVDNLCRNVVSPTKIGRAACRARVGQIV